METQELHRGRIEVVYHGPAKKSAESVKITFAS